VNSKNHLSCRFLNSLFEFMKIPQICNFAFCGIFFSNAFNCLLFHQTYLSKKELKVNISGIHSQIAGLCFVVLLLTGCGGGADYKVPELMEVSGTVILDGEPLSNTTVIFTPQAGTGGTGAIGVTDSSGKYTLNHQSGNPGIESGKYDVTFSKWAMADGSPIPEGKTAADVEAKDVIPEKFRSTNDSGPKNIAEVKANGDSFDFQLKSK